MDVTMAKAIVLAASAIGGAIAMCAAIGAGFSIGYATSKAAEAVGRQPEARGEILSTTLVGCAVAETTGIFAFIIAILLVAANPLIKFIA